MTSPSEIPEALKAKAREVYEDIMEWHEPFTFQSIDAIALALLQVRNEAIAEERAACAAIADLWSQGKAGDDALTDIVVMAMNKAGEATARAIRARP